MTDPWNDPDSDIVRDALTRRCDQCKAAPGVLCHNHIVGAGAPLPGRIIHFGRKLKP